MSWYFAYGSNLNRSRLEQHVGDVGAARRGVLRGHRLAFNKKSLSGGIAANVLPDAAAMVWGVVYLLADEAMNVLDRHEGVGDGHYRRVAITVLLDDGADVAAIAYLAGERFVVEEGAPAPAYLLQIIEGARAHGQPDDHVALIERLTAGPRRGEG